jgi:hypothetical protein
VTALINIFRHDKIMSWLFTKSVNLADLAKLTDSEIKGRLDTLENARSLHGNGSALFRPVNKPQARMKRPLQTLEIQVKP